MVDGLQLVVAILLVALGLMIGFNSGSKTWLKKNKDNKKGRSK